MSDGVSKTKHIATRISLFKDWYKLIFPFNRLISKNQTLHLRNGVVARVGNIYSSDVSVLMEVFATKSYRLERLTLPPNPVVVDVGANIGAFSLAVLHQFPGARIEAYEPSPRNFALLKVNLPSAHIEQKAIAGQSGKVRIQEKGTYTALRLVAEGGIAVEALSLDEALKNLTKIDLLKVDIEGAEYDVFAHASKATLQKIRRVIVEVHNPRQKQWFEELFRKNGLTVDWYDPQLLFSSRV